MARSALRYQTPKEFSDDCDRGAHGQPPPQSKSIRINNR
jgi:hypothetical protein